MPKSKYPRQETYETREQLISGLRQTWYNIRVDALTAQKANGYGDIMTRDEVMDLVCNCAGHLLARAIDKLTCAELDEVFKEAFPAETYVL